MSVFIITIVSVFLIIGLTDIFIWGTDGIAAKWLAHFIKKGGKR